MKDDPAQMTHYNISVGVTDAFMDAWEHDGNFDLVDPHKKQVVKTVRAQELFGKFLNTPGKRATGRDFLDAMN